MFGHSASENTWTRAGIGGREKIQEAVWDTGRILKRGPDQEDPEVRQVLIGHQL